jgi:protein-disulfide isomerase
VLAELGQAAGLEEAPCAACLAQGAYLEWPTYVTTRATEAGVTGTPTVLVAGAPVNPEPHAIAAAVSQARQTS